jgi:hypothetical protein
LLDGRTEGRALGEALHLAGIPHCYSLATTSQTLQAAVPQRLAGAIDHFKAPPILHFSAHGNSEGIGLTNGEFVSWSDLGKFLEPAHQLFDAGPLLICLSACESASGMRMAMTHGPERPFWALVSHMGKPSWSDCAVGYIVFYNRFFKDTPIDTAVQAMKDATGDPNFAVWFGHEIKRDWLNMAQRDVAEALQNPSSPQGLGLGALGLLGTGLGAAANSTFDPGPIGTSGSED